jgi:nitrogenase molybdenum-iron protein alpha/beta subunit
MDAILGRDDRLVEKTVKACKRLDCSFIAIIGTPVPSVIGTDYKALKRMMEKKTGLPVVTVDTNGMELYDAGVRKAFKEVFKTFAKREGKENEKLKKKDEGIPEVNDGSEKAEKAEEIDHSPGGKTLGILGATPLDVTFASGSFSLTTESEQTDPGRLLKDYYMKEGYGEVFVYGMGSGLEDIKKAGSADFNLVLSPAAIPAAKYLERTFGTPYKCEYPLETIPGWDDIKGEISEKKDARILIIHQQVLANELRNYCLTYSDQVQVASWFDLDKNYVKEGDIHIREEDEWIRFVYEGKYDLIIGDSLFRTAVPEYEGEWINLEHFAVSGKR